jgi:hypothetical protein
MSERTRKDRLIQTRVPQDLESTLKDEARRRRLSVSHLIRNVLEDTFNLVDNVVVEVDRVVSDSVTMAKTFQRDAQRLAATARGQTAHREGDVSRAAPAVSEEPAPAEAVSPEASEDPLAAVFAWQELVLNRPANCARCASEIRRGERAFLGQSDKPQRLWVCRWCLDEISSAQ